MTILHSLENYLPAIGGMEVLVSGLAEWQVQAGHTVHVIATHQPEGCADADLINGVRVHRIPARAALDTRDPVGLLMGRKRFAALRESIQPDVTHLHLCGPSMILAFQTLDLAPSAVVATPHCPLPDGEANPDDLNARLMRRADAVVGISEFMRGAARTYLGSQAPDTHLIYNGVPSLPEVERPDGDQLSVLTIGRAIREKGFDLVIRAFSAVAATHPDMRLRVAGGGPRLEELRELARDLAIDDRVEFLGWVSPRDIATVVAAADIFVAGSRWQEPLGLTAIEASRGGVPVIVTRVGGLAETTIDGETGFVVPSEDVPALAAALQKLVAQPDLRRSMGAAGQRFVKERFDFGRFVQAHEDLYRSVVSSSG